MPPLCLLQPRHQPLAVHDHQHRRTSVVRAGVAQVLHRVDHGGHVGQADRRAVFPRHDQRQVVSSAARLVTVGEGGIQHPKQVPDAKFYDEISYRDVMLEELKVMDQTAVTLCKENRLPLIVLNIHRPGAVASAVRGERVGTIVR